MRSKRCQSCGRCRYYKFFSLGRQYTDGLQARCKDCQHDYYKRHRAIRIQHAGINRVRRRDEIRKLVCAAKSDPCMDCGRRYPFYVMDFDHRDPYMKVDCVSVMIRELRSFTKIIQEIEKCDVVCANCHRERTFARLAQAGRAPDL